MSIKSGITQEELIKWGEEFSHIDLICEKKYRDIKIEIALNKTLIDIPRGIEVINSIPEQLKKENKK